MIEKEVTIVNPNGIHARPSALIVTSALKMKSSIILTKNDISANAKSVVNILMLAAKFGDKITIKTEGEDEAEAFELIENIFKIAYDD